MRENQSEHLAEPQLCVKIVPGLSCWSKPSEFSVNGEKNMSRVSANLRTGHLSFNQLFQHSLQDLAEKMHGLSLKNFRNCCVHFMGSVDTTQLKIQSIHMELEKIDYFFSGNCYSSKTFSSCTNNVMLGVFSQRRAKINDVNFPLYVCFPSAFILDIPKVY